MLLIGFQGPIKPPAKPEPEDPQFFIPLTGALTTRS
jgi:hypothetical protein